MITAIRLMRPTKTSHPQFGMADDMSLGAGFRFEDDPQARVIRVWCGDKYEGRVPYEACVMIYEEIRSAQHQGEPSISISSPAANQRHGKHKGRR